MAGETVARRSLFAALLAAPIVAHPMKASAMPTLKPGNIWVQVPAEPWKQFLEAARALEGFDERIRSRR